jgi:hypothetical protein
MGKNPVGVAIFNHFFLPLKPALQTLWATRIFYFAEDPITNLRALIMV